MTAEGATTKLYEQLEQALADGNAALAAMIEEEIGWLNAGEENE